MKVSKLVLQAVVALAALYSAVPAIAQVPSPAPSTRPVPVAPQANPPATLPTRTPGAPPAAGQVIATTFVCGSSSGNNPATLVQIGTRTLRSPLIVWRTEHFGPHHTPQQRCQAVSTRLTNAVAQNGGRLTSLRLATGPVNQETVICVVNGRSG